LSFGGPEEILNKHRHAVASPWRQLIDLSGFQKLIVTVEGIYISEEIKAMKLHLPKKT
jgi:hypothetical protein